MHIHSDAHMISAEALPCSSGRGLSLWLPQYCVLYWLVERFFLLLVLRQQLEKQ